MHHLTGSGRNGNLQREKEKSRKADSKRNESLTRTVKMDAQAEMEDAIITFKAL